MKLTEKISQMKNLSQIISESYSYSEVLRKCKAPTNGYFINLLKQIALNQNICCNHFDNGKIKTRKYERQIKECPVCKKEFLTLKGSKKEKVTCSKSCSNTFFRSDKNHKNYKNGISSYRDICFKYHVKKCVCCEEKKIVDVHHYDGNRENNNPENLIPLCPTHHKYFHSKYRKEVIDKIEEYRKKFINKAI